MLEEYRIIYTQAPEADYCIIKGHEFHNFLGRELHRHTCIHALSLSPPDVKNSKKIFLD